MKNAVIALPTIDLRMDAVPLAVAAEALMLFQEDLAQLKDRAPQTDPGSVPPLTAVDPGTLLRYAPTEMVNLAPWLILLQPQQVERVWIGVVVDLITRATMVGETCEIRNLVRALSVVRSAHRGSHIHNESTLSYLGRPTKPPRRAPVAPRVSRSDTLRLILKRIPRVKDVVIVTEAFATTPDTTLYKQVRDIGKNDKRFEFRRALKPLVGCA